MASVKQVSEAASLLGSLGGKALARKRPGIHQEIASLGGRATAARHPGMAKVWGQKGGRPRKKTLEELEGGCPGPGGDPPPRVPPQLEPLKEVSG